MNQTIREAIEFDNLDLFKLIYHTEYIKIPKSELDELSFYFYNKVGIYMKILCLDKYDIQDYSTKNKAIVTKEIIDGLSNIIELCLEKNSNTIFWYIIKIILPEYFYHVQDCTIMPKYIVDKYNLNIKFSILRFYIQALYDNKCNIKKPLEFINQYDITDIFEHCSEIRYNDKYNKIQSIYSTSTIKDFLDLINSE